MRNFLLELTFLFAVVAVAWPALAQQSNVAVKAALNTSPDSGFNAGFGVEAEANYQPVSWAVLHARGDFLSQRKSYLRDGATYGYDIVARVRPVRLGYVRPFGSVGAAYSGYHNSSWEKHSLMPTYGGGFVLEDSQRGEWAVIEALYSRDRRTFNKVNSLRVGGSIYYPLSGKWLLVGSSTFAFSSYLPYELASYRESGTGVSLSIGLGRKFR